MSVRSLLVLLAIAVSAIAVAVVLNRPAEPEVAGAAVTTLAETTTSGGGRAPDTTATTAEPEPTTAAPTTTTTQPTTTKSPAPTPTTLAEGEVVCDDYGDIETVGTVSSEALVELSGTAASRATPGVVWAHNDSRDGPTVYAIGPSGEDLGRFDVPGATAFDWEDMAAGPGPEPGITFLYLGDIGDNFTIRDGRITIFRVEEVEPVPVGGVLTGAVALPFAYPDGPHNAEALFIDPVDGSFYVITKDAAEAQVYRGNALGDGSSVEELELVASLDLGTEVTGADISWDGSIIAFRGYESVWMWTRSPGETVAEALKVEPCSAPAPDEPQGESIALFEEDAYITISEGANPPLHRVDRAG